MAGKKIKVVAPDPTFEGDVAGIRFEKGRAEFTLDPAGDPPSVGVYGYFQSAGYTVGGQQLNEAWHSPKPVEPTVAAPGTPENPDGIVRGAPPKDAAVD